MGVVIKTRTQIVGDVKEEVQYYFELYEDFSKFEFAGYKQPDVEAESDTETARERKYMVVDNTSYHGIPIGEIVTAEWQEEGNALCSYGQDSWYLNPKDLKEVK